MKNYYILLFLAALVLYGCTKEFLDAKPSSTIVNPTSLAEYQSILDNSNTLNTTGALSLMSSDEYFIINKTSFDALITQTQKNTYLWNKDTYGGEGNILDWNQPYKAVFCSNNVLDGIKEADLIGPNALEWNNLKGSALFLRAYAFFDLIRNFCLTYNESTEKTDLGIPLKLSADIDVFKQRSTLKESYHQIINDLNLAGELLRDDFSTQDRNRPCKAAVDALLARIYLYMGKYNESEKAADACLSKYNKLIDYNTISKSSATPFSFSSDETIFYSGQVIAYATTIYGTTNTSIGINPDLISLYSANDLRLPIFYAKNALNNYNMKRGYVGLSNYAFTGLATDEIMLIKAECAARRNDPQLAITTLNQLLLNRYKTGSFVPFITTTAAMALETILLERRKELVWRSLRWSDLKRLNKEGANITLKRNLDGMEYTLPPNSPLYVFPIPDNEIALSGIQQNIR